MIFVDPDRAWDFACSTMQYDCAQINKPLIVPQPMFDQGTLGLFSPDSPDTVYVDNTIGPYLNQVYMEAVLAHEFTHYIEFHNGTIDLYDLASRCRAESIGWRVMNAYVIVYGRPDLVDYKWYERYGCYTGE